MTRPLCPEALQAEHEARQRGFRGRCAEDDEDLLANVAEETVEAEAVEAGDTAENHEYQNKAGQIERGHQMGQR